MYKGYTILLLMLVTACGSGGDSAGSGPGRPSYALSFSTANDLPTCDSSFKDVLAYVRSSKEFQYCDGIEWTALDIGGEPGDKGQTGAAGANCYDGLSDQTGDGKVDVADCRADTGTVYEISGDQTDLCDGVQTCFLSWARLELYRSGASRLQLLWYHSLNAGATGSEKQYLETYIPAADKGSRSVKLIDNSVARSGTTGTKNSGSSFNHSLAQDTAAPFISPTTTITTDSREMGTRSSTPLTLDKSADYEPFSDTPPKIGLLYGRGILILLAPRPNGRRPPSSHRWSLGTYPSVAELATTEPKNKAGSYKNRPMYIGALDLR